MLACNSVSSKTVPNMSVHRPDSLFQEQLTGRITESSVGKRSNAGVDPVE